MTSARNINNNNNSLHIKTRLTVAPPVTGCCSPGAGAGAGAGAIFAEVMTRTGEEAPPFNGNYETVGTGGAAIFTEVMFCMW